MNGRFVARVLVFFVLVVALVGLGIYVYQVGMAQGLAQADKVPAPSTVPIPTPYGVGPYFYRPWGWGFGCFGLLIPLLILLVIFSVIRTVLWGGHLRRRGWMMEGNVPPMFDEWHKKAHEKQG